MGLLAILRLWFARPSAPPQTFRERHDAMTEAAREKAKREGRVYDAYPDQTAQPEMRLYCEARDARGRLRRQYVDLEGYSLHQVNLSTRRWQEGLAARVAEARYLLLVRLSEAARDSSSTPS